MNYRIYIQIRIDDGQVVTIAAYNEIFTKQGCIEMLQITDPTISKTILDDNSKYDWFFPIPNEVLTDEVITFLYPMTAHIKRITA